MNKGSQFRIVIGVILVVWLISFLIHLFESRDMFDIKRININDITSIIIRDGGIKGRQTKLISNENIIREISLMLQHSRDVNWHDINVKANQGECTVILVHKNKEQTELRLIRTIFSGAIIESGDYCYQNNQLMNVIVKQLK